METTGTPEKKAKTAGSGPVPRFERKFTILPANIGLAYTMLRQVCLPDREYPEDRVYSLYFDSADLEQYERSDAGDRHKDKVRVRWYSDSNNHETGGVPVYLELKTRRGFASSKQRRGMTVAAETLRPANLSRGVTHRTTLLETLAGFGHFPEKQLKPVVLITYRRYRLNEIQTGVRVSFDHDIRALAIAPELGRREREIRLANGVIEVKGPSLELPATLRRMRLMDVDWSRFSKYGSCLDAFFAEPGSLARLWPSGRLILP
jgi:hypothetical protein